MPDAARTYPYGQPKLESHPGLGEWPVSARDGRLRDATKTHDDQLPSHRPGRSGRRVRENKVLTIIHAIESLSVWVGRAFGWCILILTLLGFLRGFRTLCAECAHGLGLRHDGADVRRAVPDGRPYALCQDSHVRGDVIYRLVSRALAGADRFRSLYLCSSFPACSRFSGTALEIAADSAGATRKSAGIQPRAHPDLLFQDADP